LSVAADPEIRARREIWGSLVSLLKVYSHAASLNGEPHLVAEVAPDAVVVIAGWGELGLTFNPEQGTGSWRYEYPGERLSNGWGGWQMLSDGRLDVEGKVMEIDEAVIDWIARLTKPHGAIL